MARNKTDIHAQCMQLPPSYRRPRVRGGQDVVQTPTFSAAFAALGRYLPGRGGVNVTVTVHEAVFNFSPVVADNRMFLTSTEDRSTAILFLISCSKHHCQLAAVITLTR